MKVVWNELLGEWLIGNQELEGHSDPFEGPVR